jgi:hypothetical protein
MKDEEMQADEMKNKGWESSSSYCCESLVHAYTKRFNYKCPGLSYEKQNFKIQKFQVTVLTFIQFIISYITQNTARYLTIVSGCQFVCKFVNESQILLVKLKLRRISRMDGWMEIRVNFMPHQTNFQRTRPSSKTV